jgi:iron complex transport system substrate-binding protein
MKSLIKRKRGAYFIFGIKMKILPQKIGIIFLMSALLLSIIAGCSITTSIAPLPSTTLTGQTEATTIFPATFTDQAGRTVTIQSVPKRIVSIAPSNTEILYALGLEDKIVGVTDYCNYPPEVKQKPSVGGFSTPNIEEVVAKNPDLVLAANIHISKIVPQLETKGLTVVVLNPKTTDEIINSITLVGKVTGKQAEAKTLTENMQKRIKAVMDKTMLLSYRPSVCFIVWHDPLMIAGAGTYHDELIEKAAGFNIGHNLTGYSKDYSMENLIMANPAVIIVGIGMGDGEDKAFQVIKTEPRLKDILALKYNQVYSIDQDIVGRAGPRIVYALEQFAQFLHPQIFK